MKKSLITYLIIVFVCAIFIFSGYKICSTTLPNSNKFETYKAKVIAINNVNDTSYDMGVQNIGSSEVEFSAKIKNGKFKGETVNCIQNINELYMDKPSMVKKGDSLILTYNADNDDNSDINTNQPKWQFASFNRSSPIIILLSAFFLMILILGGLKGFKTIISLTITCLSIFLIYIPATLKGYNIYLTTIIVSIFIIVSSLVLINGINKKTLCAILGNISGVAIAAILCLIMNNILKLTGYVTEDYCYLQQLNPDKPIDLIAVVWGGVVIGALGAVMDVSMSIASSMHELSLHMEQKTFYKLFKSGMNIGKDAIGTMTNTLILAYIGSSFALVLLLIANNSNPLYLLNTEMIAVEVSQSIVGSIGILVAVPITTAIGAYFATQSHEKKAIASKH